MLGGLQLEALRNELVGGGKLTELAFHDAILAANAIPIEWLRAELLNTPLLRTPQSVWKF
jgi:uncharacterized protein (DUF885 family)